MSPQASYSRGIELGDKGSHFYRSDFQVHTPRDAQWKGPRPSDKELWANDFVAAARKKGLHAVAISDHHDFAYFPYIKRAAEREILADGAEVPVAERLIVFPALELTLSVPCQAIMILDADFPDDRLDEVLKALHFDPIDPGLEVLPQTEDLTDSGDLNKLHAKLDNYPWLKGRYIILPNVSPKGHRTLMRNQFQSKYKEMVPVGGYLDGSVSLLDNAVGKKNILKGNDPAWGSKKLAVFQTSDARSADFANLGKHASWVKWVNPTSEAIRQACLAQESRISHEQPALPNVWISRVVVSDSKFLGALDVALNPQYTALIGGRGTGKSTVLDYLRWALCDQPTDSADEDEVAHPRVRQRKLIDATLKLRGANVEVHCVINGIVHVVRRYADDGTIQLKVGNDEFKSVPEASIQSLLPIQAYSQKQLSSVSIRIEELLRFVTSPIKRKLEEVERQRLEVVDRLRENYATLQRYRNLSVEIERGELRVRSLADQAQSLRDQIAGISEADREILDGKPGHDDLRSAQLAWLQYMGVMKEDFADLLESLELSLDKLVLPPSMPTNVAPEATKLLESTRRSLTQIQSKIAGLAGDLEMATSEDGEIAVASRKLSDRLSEFDEAYKTVKEKSSAQEAKLAELASLEEQQHAARALLQQQGVERDALGSPGEKHDLFRSDLTTARKERTNALRAECDDLEESSDGLIRATLSTNQGFDAVKEKFRGLIVGSNVRTAKIDNFFEELTKEPDPAATWESVLAELEALILLEADTEINLEKASSLSRLGFTVADQQKIASKLSSDGWLDLSLTEMSDFPEFEYRAKEGEYIPFDSASAGQQASALLGALLAQSGMPLIIDQPEDDLDSDTVQQIVSRIWQSKHRRQLIFASHNANLVVNGDADLVLVCAYKSAGDQSEGHIKRQGSIDVDGVRDEITSVMEGGERAFRLRKEKYGF